MPIPSLRSFFLITMLLASSFLLSACENLPWQKQFSGLDVEMTDNSTAQVYLDGLHLGQTPLDKRDLRPGTYAFRLEPDSADKLPYETQIHLYPKTLTSVLWSFKTSEKTGSGEIFELEPLASKERAELSVTTIPEGANISLSETSYGLSPVIVDSVTPGAYDLSIEAVAHVKRATGVRLQAGYRLHVFSRLAKEAEALSPTNSTGTSPDTASTPDDQAFPPASPSADLTLQDSSETSPLGELTPPYVVIGETPTGWLRVRSQPSSVGSELTQVDTGEKFAYRSTQNGWYEIEYETGKTGWVSGQYAEIVR